MIMLQINYDKVINQGSIHFGTICKILYTWLALSNNITFFLVILCITWYDMYPICSQPLSHLLTIPLDFYYYSNSKKYI